MFFSGVMPTYIAMVAVVAGFVPMITGAVMAVAGRLFLGRVPLWYALGVVIPVSVLLWLYFGGPWLDAGVPLSERLVLLCGVQAAALVTAWWLDGRYERDDPFDDFPRREAGEGSFPARDFGFPGKFPRGP